MGFRKTAAAAGLWAFMLSLPAGAQVFNVTFLHTPPSKAYEGQDLKISGNMIGADQVSIAALAFRLPGSEDYEVRELKLVSTDTYKGIIPAADLKPPAVEYYCYAVDFEGNRHTVFASEQEPQRVPVVSPATIVPPEPKKPPPKPKTDPGAAAGAQPAGPAAPAPTFADQQISLATRAPVPVGRAPAFAAVVERRQIEGMGARTLADVLDQLPGISIARTVSGDYRIAMRGVQSDPETLVLLDGHRINDLYRGSSLLEFPAEAIERVEVIRGPGSALYGTGAFVGAINVITRQDKGVHAIAAYGLNNEVRVSAGGGWGNDAFELGGQVQFMRTAGHEREVPRDVLTGVLGTTATAGDDVSNAPGGVDDSRMQVHAQLQAVAKDLGGGELKLLGHYLYQSRGGYIGKFDSLDLGSQLQVHLVNLDLGYGVPLAEIVRFDVRGYFDVRMVDRAFQVIGAPDNDFGNSYVAGGVILTEGLRESVAYQAMTAGAELSTTIDLLVSNRLVAGLQVEYLSLGDFTQQRDTGGVTCTPCAASADGCLQIQGFELPCGQGAGPGSQDRIGFGFFAQDHWTDLLPGLDVLVGFRLDYFTDFGLTFNPRVAVIYTPIEQFGIKVMYAQAYRAPTFQELYDDASFDPLRSFQGNDKLDPVKVNTLEAGIESHLEARPLDFRLRANFFANWIDDSIESVDQGTGLASWDNVESLTVLGTEVEGIARFGERSRLFVNSSWFRAEVQVAGQESTSYINDVPQMRFNLGLDLAVLDFLNLHLGVRYGSERRNNVRQRLELLRSFRIPAYTLVRAGITTEPVLFDHLVFFAHAYNVFDHDYRDPPPRPDHLPDYVPRAPFTFMVGVGWRP